VTRRQPDRAQREVSNVVADIYAVTIASDPSAESKIDEILWLELPVPQTIPVAPLVREHLRAMAR